MASHNDPLAVVLDVFVELFSYGAGGRWTGLVTVAGDALASSVSLVEYLEFIRSYFEKKNNFFPILPLAPFLSTRSQQVFAITDQ